MLRAARERRAGPGTAGGAGRSDGGERGVLLSELVSARNGEENLQNAGGFARSEHCAVCDFLFFDAHSQLSCRIAGSSRPSTRPPYVPRRGLRVGLPGPRGDRAEEHLSSVLQDERASRRVQSRRQVREDARAVRSGGGVQAAAGDRCRAGAEA